VPIWKTNPGRMTLQSGRLAGIVDLEKRRWGAASIGDKWCGWRESNSRDHFGRVEFYH